MANALRGDMDPRLVLKGCIIGVANIIPGVSGGTLAVVLGIYDRLISSIGNFLFDKENRRGHVIFLAQVALGAAVAIFLLSNLMNYLYENHEYATIFFFMGLIVGSIPTVLKQHTDMRPNMPNILLFIIGFLAILSLELINVSEGGTATGSSEVPLLFVAGILSAAAMIVPGFSGSFVLVAIGVYWELIDAVKSLDIVPLISFGIGALIGILVVSKALEKILRRYPSKFYYFILGLVIASIFVIFPGVPADAVVLAKSLASLCAGALISIKLSK
ncbi:MAG TPA: DUF368 domain-containing protein [Candidatus Methanofastidiosa archaeon]|nr:DUF368 domain-containing protein [Candidatus Methanofastidiosa archaeon]HPR42017.1 DUF368 domain-containing protein [Candidatus Methanofastidiosa archaeon]